MAYRFIHTADIHLDSPLKSLAMRDPALAERIGNATRQSFVGIIDLCLSEQVDALLIAGDLYDGDQTSMKTARFLGDQFARLQDAGIDVHIIRGNHDALSRITRELVLPPRVKLYGPRAESVRSEHETGGRPVVLHGMSFAQAQAPESLLPKYPRPVEGAINIGLMHTSLGGAPGHDPYAPCSLNDLEASGYQYWALGHIHVRSVHQGAASIVMPGIPQGRDINEAGDKSVSLVTVADDGSIRIEERKTAIARFERIEVSVEAEADWSGLPGLIGRRIEAALENAGQSHLVARLHLVGTTPLSWQIRRDLDLIKAEAERLAERTGRASIELVDNRTFGLETKSASGPDPVAQLARLIEGQVLTSNHFRDMARDLVADFSRSLPPDLRGLFGQDEASVATILDDLARDGSLDVLAHLKGVGSPEGR